MHFFSKKRTTSGTSKSDALTQSGIATSNGDPDRPLNSAQADVNRQSLVAIASDTIVNQQQPDDEGDVFQDPEDVEQHEAPADAEPSQSNKQRLDSTSKGGPASDSGYGSSSTTHNRSKSLSSPRAQRGGDLKPIPVLWAGSAEREGSQDHARTRSHSPGQRQNESQAKRANSLRSFRSAVNGDRDRDRAGDGASVRRRVSLSSGSFAGGAGTVGPEATIDPNESFQERKSIVEASLTKKQKRKLGKAEAKEGKRHAKVVKEETKAEKRALEAAIKEMADIQKMQKDAIKEEARRAADHVHALRKFHKDELDFFAARAKYEKAQADLHSIEDTRDASRTHAENVTAMLQEKAREIEHLKAQKAVDDREREAKLLKLVGKA